MFILQKNKSRFHDVFLQHRSSFRPLYELSCSLLVAELNSQLQATNSPKRKRSRQLAVIDDQIKKSTYTPAPGQLAKGWDTMNHIKY